MAGEAAKKVYVIINPAAGQDQPILKILNAAFRPEDVSWEALITKEAGDGRQMAQKALQDGADVVAVYGGDGTVMEVASGLIGSDTPLAILPGGTANVMSLELGIPNDLAAACALILNPEAVLRPVDMGQLGEQYFILRAGMGFEAAMVEGADRELKDKLGVLAYAFSAFQALANPPVARYRLTLDGEVVETEGLTCIIANSGMMGAQGLPVSPTMSPTINVSDGLLDVLVVTRTDLPSLVALAASVVGGKEQPPALQQWQVREVYVEADPPQKIQVDGEISGETPIRAHVVPHAIRVITPPV